MKLPRTLSLRGDTIQINVCILGLWWVLPSLLYSSHTCRRCCSWRAVQLCQPPVPSCSSRSPPLYSSGRTSPCLSHSLRRWSKRFGHDRWKSRFFLCLRGFSALFFHKVFGSTLGNELILEFTKEMFTMREFEQVKHLSYIALSLFLCVTSDISSSSGSSSFPPCCALSPACSAPVILYPGTLAWMRWSAWSSPKPRPPQMVPWLLKRTRCFSLDRPLGQILRTIFIFPTSIPPVWLETVVSYAGVLARRSPAALAISQESQRWCCLWSHLLERWQRSLTCHCSGALWCFCHTSGITRIIFCSLCGLMSQFKIVYAGIER